MRSTRRTSSECRRFRPGRGTHDALDALCVGIHSKKVSYILDADIRSFFDEINQKWLVRFLEHRIGDRRIIRLIQKWLKAGVMEDGVVRVSEQLAVLRLENRRVTRRFR
jgi:RNA-directed DNA polymerase